MKYSPNMDLWGGIDANAEREAKDQDYDYGDLGDLRPGSKKHDDLVKMVLEYADRGYATTSDSIAEYTKIDEVRDGFMPADEVDAIRSGDDPRKPVNIVNPMLYSHEHAFLTAMHRAFFYGETFHRYAGSGSAERAAKAALAQKIMARIATWFSTRRAFDIHCGDAYGYGRAYMWGKWSKKMAPALVTQELDSDLAAVLGSMGLPYNPGDAVRFIDEDNQVRREGTQWIPLDNYQVLTDSATDPDHFQDSSFFGWVVDTDALLLIGNEDDPEEGLFNCRALLPLARARQGKSSYWRDVSAKSNRLQNRPSDDEARHSSRCQVIYMFCRLIPRDWGLGESKKPQVWFFGVGADRVLIKSQRVRTLHGGMPIVCSAPNARGHSIAPVSNLMIALGQQIAVDFLVKQDLDFQDLIKNGKFIFDPMMLDWRQINKGGGPMGIPMKKRALGKEISTFYHQIEVQNVTDGNWAKAERLIQMAEQGSGITEPPNQLPDHAGSQGIAAIQSKSIGRMARLALIIDEQCRQQMAYQEICNVAQWMSTEVLVDILGRDDDIIRKGYGLPPGATGLLVSHWDIEPDLDVVALAAMAQGPKNVPAMTEFAKTFMGVPGVMEDFVQRFRYEEFLVSLFREMGVSDIDWFRYNVTNLPTEVVRANAQAGNLVSLSQANPQWSPRMAA